jgi:Ca2+-binding RTX toxin-like protein
VTNVETVFGSSNNDTIVIANTAGATTTVTGGLGADTITASAGQDNFRFASVADSPSGGASDVINNFDAFGDTFTFSGMTIANSSINYIAAGGFAGSGQASALLAGNVLQIDVNGDGAMGIGDMEINLANLNGTLHNSNFLIT